MSKNTSSSGQGVIRYEGDRIIKEFFSATDYEQEKYFLKLLHDIPSAPLPTVLSTDDEGRSITMRNAGRTLDELDWRQDRHMWAKRIAQSMNPVWSSLVNIPTAYRKNKDESYQYIADFLHDGYFSELSKVGVEPQLVADAQLWLRQSVQRVRKEAKGQSAIIHFDLSPRNVVFHANRLTVIDWSRAVLSERIIELGIMREKFELVGEPATYLADTSMENVDIVAADRIALCFRIYRQAKQVGHNLTLDAYNDALNLILAS